MEGIINRVGLHAFVSGKVQGVWFRQSTKREAEALGITGWAKNLPDGRVEVMLFGDKDAVEQLRNWLYQGPPKSEVIDVVAEACEWQAVTGFKTY